MRILARLYDWLAVSDAPQNSDLIFVLAGRECRKHFGLQLFSEGWAPTLLLSVGRFEIRSFAQLELTVTADLVALAAPIAAPQRHFFVTVQAASQHAEPIRWQRFGTWCEIHALAGWLKKQPKVQTLTVVSSAFHLRRVRWCCSRLLPKGIKLRFIGVPFERPTFNRNRWWRSASSRRLVVMEVVKVILYPLLLAPATLFPGEQRFFDGGFSRMSG